MDKKQAWLQMVQEKSEHYLNLHDGGFDEKMRARLVSCDYENQTVTYAFPTQTWQINERAASTAAPSRGCSTPPSAWWRTSPPGTTKPPPRI